MDGVAIVALLFFFIVLVLVITALFHCCRDDDPFPPDPSHHIGAFTLANQHGITIELGLDEATLRHYPKLLYAQAKVREGNSTTSCCSICLADYRDADVLRLLPYCGHLFHLKCVDSWLRLHATCPICRNAPLAEAVPFDEQLL